MRRLDELGDIAVAVSGGVDSMTLAVVAHQRLDARVEMFHAVSPAVPAEATERVARYAHEQDWRLRVVDAGEFADDDYRRNPRDRCYFCKTNLYGTLASHAHGAIVAGTNTDDLGEYRPGLLAAQEHGVAHPYVDAGISKATVRAIAHDLGLTDVAELPAAPCLASRIETGIAIQPRQLALVHRVEQEVTARLEPAAVRCRVRASGIVVELDRARLERLTSDERVWLETHVRALLDKAGSGGDGPGSGPGPGPVRIEPYRTGSAFLAAGELAGPATSGSRLS